MARALLSRLGQAVLTMFLLLVLVFSLVRLSGDPALFLLSPLVTPAQQARFRAELGLDEPIPVQFLRYITDLAHGDLGVSFRTNTPVVDLIMQRLPATLTMTGAATVLILVIGIPLGIYSAYWRGGLVDAFARFLAALGQAMPPFWVGLLLIVVFAVNLRLLPAGGFGRPEHVILPTVVLAIGGIAGLVRILRSSMIEVLESDYVRFHRVKGLPERTILWKHGLRNAGLASLTYMAVVFAGLLTGSVLVETVFVWPGVGRLMIEAVEFRDFNTAQGVLLLFSATYIFVNLVADSLYVVLNPRLR